MANVTKDNASEILKDYLSQHGISKTFVAKKVGLSPQAFNRRLRESGAFDADLAFKVAKVLNIKPTIFLSSSYTKSLK